MAERTISELLRNRPAVTLGPDALAAEACQLKLERRIGAILVTDADQRLLGIFTGRDAVRLLVEGETPAHKLQDVMTRQPWTMQPGSTAIEALRLMEDGGFRHIPVVHDERVVGIVSWGDFRGAEHERMDNEIGYWERL